MGGGIARALALSPLRCRYFACTRLISKCQLLYMLHSDMERMRVGGGLTAGRSQHPDQVPVVERLGAAARAGACACCTCVGQRCKFSAFLMRRVGAGAVVTMKCLRFGWKQETSASPGVLVRNGVWTLVLVVCFCALGAMLVRG